MTDLGSLIIEEEFLDAVRKKPLKVLDLGQTKVLFPRERFFFKAFSHLEKKLNISPKSCSAVATLFQALYENELIFQGFPNLKTLDVSFPADHSMITFLDGLRLQRLNTLKLHVVNITPTENGTTRIDLDGNLISCSCDNRHYFNWTIFYNETGL